MASNPNTPRTIGERLKRLAVYGTVSALGITGLAACANGEAQAQKPPTTQSGELTPGATPTASETTPAPAETEKPAEALVGVIDTSNLSPEAVKFAKSVTPEALYSMSPEERAEALQISPELYGGDIEKLADLQFVQFAAMIGLANNAEFVKDSRETQGWVNTDYYTGFGHNLMDTVYGGSVSKYSETAANTFATIAMRTEGLIGTRESATEAGQKVGDYKVKLSKVPGSTESVGGDTVMNSADVVFKMKFESLTDFTALVNDPNIMDPNSPVLGDGVPQTKEFPVTFSDVKDRDGNVAPSAVIIESPLIS